MKILDVLGESLRTERNTQQSNANILRDLYSERNTIKKELNAARIGGDEDDIAEMVQQLADIDADIKQMEGGVTEAKNHMGDREYQSYSSWKAACKKAYPGCSFRGDKDIGAAVVGNKDVGEWDGAVGSVYSKVVTEGVTDYDDKHSANKTGKTRAQLLAIYAKTKSAAAAEQARKAGASRDELKQALSESSDVDAWTASMGDFDVNHPERHQSIGLYSSKSAAQKAKDAHKNGKYMNLVKTKAHPSLLKESQHDLDMIAGLTKALNQAKAKYKESKDDLRTMTGAARTEREHDAVDDFKKRVEKDAQRVRRITRRIELRKAVHNSGMNDSKGE